MQHMYEIIATEDEHSLQNNIFYKSQWFNPT